MQGHHRAMLTYHQVTVILGEVADVPVNFKIHKNT